jgi:5-methylcytosine-specific restriction endonuclease McrA
MTEDQKEKARQRSAQWRIDNPEKVKENNAKYRNPAKAQGYNEEYRVAHADRLRENAATRYAANPEPVKERSAQWQKDNPEKVKIAAKKANAKYRAEHPEQVKADKAAWDNAHPERCRDYTHRRRVRLRDGIVEDFLATEIFERDHYVCGLCDEPIDPFLSNRHPMMASLDHIIPITKGGHHTRDNVQAAHLRCNLSKGNRG